MNIKVEHNPSQKRLELLGVFDWNIWTKEVSKIPWYYGNSETCYFLEGEVIVTPRARQPVTMGKGDLVIFPAGMACTWDILSDVKKHYLFS